MTVRVAITTRVVGAADYDEPRDALAHDWIRLLEPLGAAPLLVPNALVDPTGYLRATRAQALILSGGDDLFLPELGQDPSGDPLGRPLRDATERALLRLAVEAQLPVLGVCRGLQLVNSFFGGRLQPVLSGQPGVLDAHVRGEHVVVVRGEGLQAYGSEWIAVNSYHRHGVTTAGLAPELDAWGLASGNVVEGLRHRSLPIWAVQWHPERPGPSAAGDRALISRLLGMAGKGAS